MKRMIMLTAERETIFEIAIKRLKRIKGLHITQIGLERGKTGDKDKHDRSRDDKDGNR